MKKNRVFFVMILVMSLIIMNTVSIQFVLATEDDTSASNYNIEVVVDASGSLKKTDNENNRYTAIDIFLQTLREKGNNVGTVVFTSKIEADTGLSKMNDKNSKEKLSKQIKEYVPDKGDTNIGLALQTAVDKLKANNNNSKNIILLLSDGNTDMGSPEENKKSLEIEDKAVKQCIAEGIKVYGICLNNDGTANLGEFKNITGPTSGAFLEVKSSENLVGALKNFYGQIFNTKFISDTKTVADGIAKKSIEVPAYGIEELNITINNASKLSEVKITKPNSIDMTANEFGGISSRIGDYYFIKISEPESGTWTVSAKGENGTKIVFDFVFNSDNTVSLKTVTGEDSYSLNEPIELLAIFYVNDTELIGKKYYEKYTGTLVVQKDGSTEKKRYSMKSNGDNGVKGTLLFDKEGTYKINAVFTCGEFENSSDPITISVGNSLPVFLTENEDDIQIIKIKKLFSNSKTIDIGQFFSDLEDDELKLTILASSYENDEIDGPNGNEITLNNLTDGKITVQAVDKDGGTVKGVIQFEVTNLTWIILLAVALILLIIVGIILFFVIKAKKRFFAGYLNVFSASEADDSDCEAAYNFSGKYYLSNLGLRNHQFNSDMYFKVLPDKNVFGDGSHKLQLISSKIFYDISSGMENPVKTLYMQTGGNYKIRSISQNDIDNGGMDDSIIISLQEN